MINDFELQRLLKDVGFYTGAIDGIFGNKSWLAVENICADTCGFKADKEEKYKAYAAQIALNKLLNSGLVVDGNWGIKSQAAWSKYYGKSKSSQKVSGIKYITIHCTASPIGRGDTAEDITQWDIERFSRPSYHYVIEETGNIVSTLPENKLGAHTGGHNTGNIGISYIGGIDKEGKPQDTRTDAQKKAMRDLINELKGKYPNAKILGHNEWAGVNKACPSFSVKSWLLAGMPI